MSSRRSGLVAVLAIALVSQLAVWAVYHRPDHAADTRGLISGFSFSPYGRSEDPADAKYLDHQTLRDDVELVSAKVHSLRTYGATGGLEMVPAAAARYGLTVTLGAWVDADRARSEAEIASVIEIANRAHNIDRIIVGNETIHRADFPISQLIADIERVRENVSVPVGTAEPWYVWLEHPELSSSVDFMGVHILPYWEGVPAEDAIAYIDRRLKELRFRFPGKPIVLAEVGWPSDGARIGVSVATLTNQAQVLRDFVQYAQSNDLEDYFIVEAFDQPWKKSLEGLAGAYWGVYTAERQPKFEWAGTVVDRTTWPVWALFGGLIGLLPLLLALRLRPQLQNSAALALALVGQGVGSMIAVSVLLSTERYLDAGDWVMWSLLMLCELFLFVILVIEIIEAAALFSISKAPQRGAIATLQHWPKVSIHVPCCNEPPELLRETLDALGRLDYPDFEVLVVDNNTKDPAVSDAIAAHCGILGARFRFLHLPRCPGYKAGALNRALAVTASDAQLIAVVDSDYVVEPGWLKAAIPHFSRSEVGIVQAPQDYRDGKESTFKSACYWEYRGFFRLGMVFRAEDSAIIQHGTMTIVRKNALADSGGWDETCITEDAELGLRLFAEGWKSVYLSTTYGRGLMPDGTEAYGRQRFRWAFGAMQILRNRAGLIFGLHRSKLTFAQRYHFIAGWLPWIGDGAGLLVAVASILWASLAAIWPKQFEPPEAHFLIPVLAVFALRQLRLWWLYGRHVDSTFAQRIGAMLAGGALAYSVARAVLSAVIHKHAPFKRTPKARPAPKIIRSILAVRDESLLLGMLVITVLVLVLTQETSRLDVQLWLAVLALQAWPFLAALILAVQATYQKPVEWRYPQITMMHSSELKEAAQ